MITWCSKRVSFCLLWHKVKTKTHPQSFSSLSQGAFQRASEGTSAGIFLLGYIVTQCPSCLLPCTQTALWRGCWLLPPASHPVWGGNLTVPPGRLRPRHDGLGSCLCPQQPFTTPHFSISVLCIISKNYFYLFTSISFDRQRDRDRESCHLLVDFPQNAHHSQD